VSGGAFGGREDAWSKISATAGTAPAAESPPRVPTLAPPPRSTVVAPTQPARYVEEPDDSENAKKPGDDEVQRALSRNRPAIRVPVATEANDFSKTSIYMPKVLFDQYRQHCKDLRIQQNVRLVELAVEHGDGLVKQSRTAIRYRRGRGPRVGGAARMVANFTAEELNVLDTLAQKCRWSRSHMVAELLKRSL
jgi:hypothetical protein